MANVTTLDWYGRPQPQSQNSGATGQIDFRQLYAPTQKPDPNLYMKANPGSSPASAGYQYLDRQAYTKALSDWELSNYTNALDMLGGQVNSLSSQADELLSSSRERRDQLYGDITEEMDYNRAMRDKFEALYAPLREDYIRSSREGITPDYRGAMGMAEADLTDQFDMARQENARDMSRYGINPTDGRFVSSSRALSLAEAAARGSGRTSAYRAERDRVENTNWARLNAAMGTQPNPTTFSNAGLIGAQTALNRDSGNEANYYLNAAQQTGELMGRYAADNQPGAYRVVRNSVGQIVA